MVRDRPLFILAGNGPYANRGCEAITRGTVKILRNYFQDPAFLCISDPQDTDFNQQCRDEMDPAITHKKMHTEYYFGRKSLIQRIICKFDKRQRKYKLYDEMSPYLDDALAILSLGGDNYSLDYGKPVFFTDLDDVVLERKRPLILWGASVGPFDTLPEYERYMIDHLGNLTGIFARESVTVDYLTKNRVTENVHRVADPAFLMDPVEPRDVGKSLTLKKDPIGINLSPLMAKYVTGGDLPQWERIAANIISNIVKKTSHPLYLIPHVTIPASNDFTFLEKVWNLTDPQIKSEITLTPPYYNAAEIKWIIGHMSLFAGARTHSTIAALSSYVPTMSFAYSIKAKGINRDIFGHEEYCLNPDQLTTEIVTSHMESMIANTDDIIMELKEKIPLIQKRAMNAGQYLKDVIARS